jgi:hypothetical protein
MREERPTRGRCKFLQEMETWCKVTIRGKSFVEDKEEISKYGAGI